MDEQEDVMFGSLETIEALLTGGPNPHITEDVVVCKPFRFQSTDFLDSKGAINFPSSTIPIPTRSI